MPEGRRREEAGLFPRLGKAAELLPEHHGAAVHALGSAGQEARCPPAAAPPPAPLLRQAAERAQHRADDPARLRASLGRLFPRDGRG